jgi:hypothetical protein
MCLHCSRPRKREKADYTAPVSFVSKGVAGGADKATKDEVGEDGPHWHDGRQVARRALVLNTQR